MRTNCLSAASFVLVTLLTANTVLAQTVSAEKAKLEGMQASIATLQATVKSLQAEQSSAQAALDEVSNLDSPEKTALDTAQQMLDDANAVFSADPSPENKSRLKNTEFKFALAERKFKKANEQFAGAEQAAAEIAPKLAAAQQQLTTLITSLAAQQVTLEKTQVTEQKRRNEESLLKQQAAAAEIASLRAELEQQKRQEQARKLAEQQRLNAEAEAKALAAEQARQKATAAQAALANLKPTAKPSAEQAAAAKPAAPTSVVETATAPQTAVPKLVPAVTQPAIQSAIQLDPTAVAAANKTSGVLFLSSKQQVQAEESRLQQAIKDANKKKGYNRILNIKSVASTESTAHTLRPLGNEQYRGKATIDAGDNIFSIGFNSWPQTVKSTDNNTYIVIFDRSNPKQPRLVYYPENLSDS